MARRRQRVLTVELEGDETSACGDVHDCTRTTLGSAWPISARTMRAAADRCARGTLADEVAAVFVATHVQWRWADADDRGAAERRVSALRRLAVWARVSGAAQSRAEPTAFGVRTCDWSVTSMFERARASFVPYAVRAWMRAQQRGDDVHLPPLPYGALWCRSAACDDTMRRLRLTIALREGAPHVLQRAVDDGAVRTCLLNADVHRTMIYAARPLPIRGCVAALRASQQRQRSATVVETDTGSCELLLASLACGVSQYIGVVPATRLNDTFVQCAARVAHELCRELHGECTLRLGQRECGQERGRAYTIDITLAGGVAASTRVVFVSDGRTVGAYARRRALTALLVCHVADRFEFEETEQRALSAVRDAVGDQVTALLVVSPQALSGDRAAVERKANDVAQRCVPRARLDAMASVCCEGVMLTSRPFARRALPIVAFGERHEYDQHRTGTHTCQSVRG